MSNTNGAGRTGRFAPHWPREDHRARLPSYVSRFLGYRARGKEPPYDTLPFPPFTWLKKIPMRFETLLFAWVGSFGAILLVEAIMASNTAFRDVYRAPIIITSFGASAVLLFGVIESPLAQPRNLVLGHTISALVAICISRLFALNPRYNGYLENTDFHGTTFVNGGLSMATALVAQILIGSVHPPAGATALNAAVQSEVVSLSWNYLPVVLASSLIMLGWALIINNIGRRRYPVYWWQPDEKPTAPLTQEEEAKEESDLKKIEEGRSTTPATRSSEAPRQALFQRLENPEGN